jgi:cell wall-associated NlpC family hydrolase
VAIRILRPNARPRKLLLAIATLGTVAAVALVATPASATPASTDTVTSVTAQLRTIAQQNEAISEQLNLVIADVAAKKQALASAQTAALQAAAEYAKQRSLLSATFTAEYEGGSSFSQTGALLNSTSGAEYADKLTTLSMMSAHRADVLSKVTAAKSAATTAQTSADSLLKQATAKQDSLNQQKATLAGDQKKYESLLNTLSVPQRTAYQSVGQVSQDVSQYMIHSGPAAAQTAVNFALAQVGKPYVYDAAGPGSFDCSGLTMAAWAAAGVKLPHNAAAQYGYGTHVAESALQPGDLLFMYHPIGHVTIYIGNGLMVSAPEPGDHVKIVTVASQQNIFVGATSFI